MEKSDRSRKDTSKEEALSVGEIISTELLNELDKLSLFRGKLLENMEVKEIAKDTLLALSEINENNPVLRIKDRISGLDNLLIWSSDKAKYIKGIAKKDIDLSFDESTYREENKRFEVIYQTPCPVVLIQLYDLVKKINLYLTDDYCFEPEFINFDIYWGIYFNIFSHESIPANAMIRYKQGSHELNYFPFANYGSDSVSYGLLYDYTLRGFFVSAYSGDGSLNAYDNIMTPFVKDLKHSLEYIGVYLEDEDFEIFQNETISEKQIAKCLDDAWDSLKYITVLFIVDSYLRENPVVNKPVDPVEWYRYRCPYGGEQTIKEKYDNHYLFNGTNPTRPISLKHFAGEDLKTVSRRVEIIENIVEVYYFSHKSFLLSAIDENLYRVKRLGERDKGTEFQGVVDSIIDSRRKDLDHKKKASVDSIKKIFDFTIQEQNNGFQGYAFIVAIIFWDRCLEDGKLSDLAVKLLDRVDEELCPEFIKKTARLHAKVRHDRSIST